MFRGKEELGFECVQSEDSGARGGDGRWTRRIVIGRGRSRGGIRNLLKKPKKFQITLSKILPARKEGARTGMVQWQSVQSGV